MRGWRLTAWLVGVALAAGCGTKPVDTGPLPSLYGAALAQARAQHRTRLLVQKAAPEIFEPDVPMDATVVRYPAPGGPCLAWLLRPKGTGPFPAVLYAHAGKALGTGDYHAAKPFVDAGYVVLLPAWRGENDNPGHYEMFYGEVADADAALDYLAGLPDVNPKRLYAVGHDTGATIVMLLAELTPRLKAVGACGGTPDLRTLIEEKKRPVFPGTPYDWRDPLENDLRSPARHLRDLACPLYLYYAEKHDDSLLNQAGRMQQEALAMGREVHVKQLLGSNHNTAIEPAVADLLREFKPKSAQDAQDVKASPPK